MFTERNQLKQQCTQAIRQWDTAIRERNEYKEQYGKVSFFCYYGNYTQIFLIDLKDKYTIKLSCQYTGQKTAWRRY